MADVFAVGDRVRLAFLPTYVKTADSVPMLRPSTVVQLGEEGMITGRQPGNYWVVRFSKGTFLLESRYLEPVDNDRQPSLSSGSNAQ